MPVVERRFATIGRSKINRRDPWIEGPGFVRQVMSTTETESESTPVETDPVEAGSDDPWYLTTWGLVVFVVDAVLVVLVMLGTSGVAASMLEPLGIDIPEAVIVDAYIYVFAVLGALGYVFTAVVREFDRTTEELVKYNVRVMAALPLAGGVYLLSELILGEVPSKAVLAGLAFVTGLYVNRVYERIGMMADRLIPPEKK